MPRRTENQRSLSAARRRAVQGGVALGAVGLVVLVFSAGAQSSTPARPSAVGAARSGRQVSLYDQLRVGLKATTKADLEFIDRVVLRVNQGVLPRRMVDSTFLWARNRYKNRPSNHRLRPIVYFQPALERQAKKIGVAI